MTGINITLAYAKELIDECITERGEGYKYERPLTVDSCSYVHPTEDGGKEPGCGVGMALNKAGVPLDVLEEYESINAQRVLELLVQNGHVQSYESWAARFLDIFQTNQDNGWTWAESRETALNNVPRPSIVESL